MDQVHVLATHMVGRGVAALWAGLGIVVLPLMFEPALALHAGGVLALAIASYLALRSERASRTASPTPPCSPPSVSERGRARAKCRT